jgi:hypothetical protein
MPTYRQRAEKLRLSHPPRSASLWSSKAQRSDHLDSMRQPRYRRAGCALFLRACRCCTASRRSGWGCHQSMPSRTQRHLRARPPGPRRIQVHRCLSSQPPMPPRARASRAFAAPSCAAVRSQRHRSAIIALPVAYGGYCGSRRSLAPSFSPSLWLRLAAHLCAELLAQPALRLIARCPSGAISRRCEGCCGTRRRVANDYPAQPRTTPRPGAPPPASAAAGHRRRHVSIAPPARSAPAELLQLRGCPVTPAAGGSRSGCLIPPAPLRVWPCTCEAPRPRVQREPLSPRRPAVRCACAAAASAARAVSVHPVGGLATSVSPSPL